MNLTYYWFKALKKLRGKAIKNSKIHKTSKVEAGSEIVNTYFDKHSFCGYNCVIVNSKVGSFCSIANNVVIGGAMHPVDWVSTSPVFYDGKDSVRTKFATHKRSKDKTTIIEHDVWIGEKALIKQGVKIGIGAVIGMGSIITRDVDPYSIMGGNPARLIRKRFDDETISKLIESKWWEFKDEQLKEFCIYFTNPIEFINKF